MLEVEPRRLAQREVTSPLLLLILLLELVLVSLVAGALASALVADAAGADDDADRPPAALVLVPVAAVETSEGFFLVKWEFSWQSGWQGSWALYLWVKDILSSLQDCLSFTGEMGGRIRISPSFICERTPMAWCLALLS